MADQRATYEIKLKDSFSGGLSKINQEVDGFERNVQQSTESAGSGFSKLKDKIIGLGLAVGAGALIKNVATLGIEMEQTRVSFTTFLGSAEKANKAIADLNQFSNVTPFDNAQVIKAGKGLLAFGVAQDKLIPTLKSIGDISAGTGKDFNELATIYGKARVAGTLYAEDINQLVEAGVPIMGEFAKALGTTEDQVKKMASQGKLKFSDLETAFQNLTGSGGMFFDLMQKQSETVGGRLSTILGKLQTIGIAIGEALLPAIGYFADLALGILDNGEALKTFAIAIGIATAAWGVYQVYTLASTVATWSLTGAMSALSAAMKANPVGFIIGGLALLTTALVSAWRHSETFRGVVMGLLEVGKTLMSVFAGVGKIIGALFTKNFASIPSLVDDVKSDVQSLGGAFEKGRQKQREKELEPFRQAFEDNYSMSSSNPSAATLGGANTPSAAKSAATKKDKVSSGISGSSPKNVTLNITKLIETINFNKQDMKQSTTQMTDMVKRALLTALNDVAIVQS